MLRGGSNLLGDFMFTRSPSAEPRTLESRSVNRGGANGVHRETSTGSMDRSVIGNDLRIIGQGLKIIGRGVLQVDGEIEGDVQGAEVIVGEKGKVTGMVAGQRVVIHGHVSGAVCGKAVALQATSHVEGDVHHMALAIEQGAVFEGRSRRAASEGDLNSVVEGRSSGQLAHHLRAVGN
jgi:cytoskeletal protein CcmA (bactofilin family)